jgi:SNF2 family DNA or RNA helicase
VFVESVNEIEYLYKRMAGLVLVKFKKDCLDLPDKQYLEISVKPTVEILRACKLIQAKSTRAIQALTLIREISDGFQYFEAETGSEQCTECHGNGTVIAPTPDGEVDSSAPSDEQIGVGFHDEEITCPKCGGSGSTKTYTRDKTETKSPKDDIFIDYLDEYEDAGRFIVWGGFTGTLDRLEVIAHRYGWATLRVDGGGYVAKHASGITADDNEFLQAMDLSSKRYKEFSEKYPKICFVGNPKAGGMALTLTASPIELFYSNGFDGEARMQAEDRGHRIGMDKNKGLTIVDLIMLPTDKLVLDNLKAKKKLQNMSMGELERVMKI